MTLDQPLSNHHATSSRTPTHQTHAAAHACQYLISVAPPTHGLGPNLAQPPRNFKQKLHATTPRQWKHRRITVMYKSGDKQQLRNYRPISATPLLYQIFSWLLYNRMEPTLDSQQSYDQAGFRRKFCTEDHLFTTTMIQEIAQEWQIPIWIATLDFKRLLMRFPALLSGQPFLNKAQPMGTSNCSRNYTLTRLQK